MARPIQRESRRRVQRRKSAIVWLLTRTSPDHQWRRDDVCRAMRCQPRASTGCAAQLASTPLPSIQRSSSPWKRAVEDDLAEELGLESGEVIIDFPVKPAMFQLDLLIERRDGRVQRLGLEGVKGVLDLPKVARELYTTARVLRVFTFDRREVSAEQVLDRITRPIGAT